MKTLLACACVFLLAACGSGGPPPPDWKTDAADLITRYQKHALLGENTLAERYFQQALAATGGAGQLEETARLWLVRCATRRAMLIQDSCDDYRTLVEAGARNDDLAYYQWITLQWQTLNPAHLPAHYTRLLGAEPDKRSAQLAAMTDPLSRLLAASLLVQQNPDDALALSSAIDTASAQGWRQPLLTLLHLRLTRPADPETLRKTRLQIQLVETALMPAK